MTLSGSLFFFFIHVKLLAWKFILLSFIAEVLQKLTRTDRLVDKDMTTDLNISVSTQHNIVRHQERILSAKS